MSVAVNDLELSSMLPVTGCIGEIKVAGRTIAERIVEALDGIAGQLTVQANFFPSPSLVEALRRESGNFCIVSDGAVLLSRKLESVTEDRRIPVDSESLIICYPWDLIRLTERVVGALAESDIRADVRPNVNIDGVLVAGEGTVLLPGVYIEGKVVIGRNCKIGPNCYIRGNTSIGDNCHIGQAVEIKNSLLMDKVSAGHLSYLGDSVVCSHVNFGAGTVGSNLRHDGKNHRSLVGSELIDTGRRKFGTVVGENVHTGIHTSIYPGRKIFANVTTRPGEIVDHDKVV